MTHPEIIGKHFVSVSTIGRIELLITLGPAEDLTFESVAFECSIFKSAPHPLQNK